MALRSELNLSTGWWVSVSARDALLAATQPRWKPSDLELADNPDNHPKQIALPGGWKYGMRPGKATETIPADAFFVGSGAGAVKRLPAAFLTYARRVKIPKTWARQTVFLHLNNARYHVTISINGTPVGHYVGGLEPHRFDVTTAVKTGWNTIVVTVGDVGVSGHQAFDPHNFTGNRLPTCKEIQNNLVHPVNYGGHDGRGIEELKLEAVPPVRVEYVFANPKVSTGKLRYTVALTNDTAKPVRVRVTSEAVRAKRLVDESVTVPARRTKKITREVAWPDAILWDTDHPHLYDLKTALRAGGKVLDVHRDYFGFREFTVNGHNFLLNGKKIHLHGQSGHVGPAQHAMSLAQKIKFLRIAKEEGHINHVRLHAKPQDRRWVEAADRVGMLITTETALWTTNFYSFDFAGSEEACHQNIRQHFLEALVRRDRNSPSVIIWSLSNEMSPITPWDLTDPVLGPKMSAMTRIFKRILDETAAEDDSRLVQMSSAMDFIGHLPMYNLHYPKNWSAFPDYPNTAYWLDGAFKFPWYGPGRDHMPAWSWRKDKPLYFGEYACIHGATPDNQASIVGDGAFDQRDFGSAQAAEKLWWIEAQAYRRQDVSGFCAWAFLLTDETDCRKLLAKPEAARYIRAIRPLAVLDHSYRRDYFAGDEVAIPLSVHNDTRHDRVLTVVCQDERLPARRLFPGENVAFTNRFLAPHVTRRTELAYRVKLLDGKKVVDEWAHTFVIWPKAGRREMPAYVLDRPTAAQLAELGLVEAKGFAEGNRLEITYAYPCAPFHPVMQSFTAEDFALWGADYYVARRCVEIPQEGNVRPLLVAGTSTTGLTCSPLLEVRRGQATYIVSMLELDNVPVATRVQEALAAYRPQWGEPAAICAESPRLREVGYTGECISVAQVPELLAAGRTVYVHGHAAELVRQLQLPGEVTPGKAAQGEFDVFRHVHPLTAGLTNGYLYWIVDKHKVAPWTHAPMHPEPASALIKLPANTPSAWSLTRRGALTVYAVGPGTLVIDTLRWDLPLDEPERARRYLMTLLTNLGVPLATGADKVVSQDFETAEERRERGHF